MTTRNWFIKKSITWVTRKCLLNFTNNGFNQSKMKNKRELSLIKNRTMKKLAFILLAIGFALTVQSQDNPYDIFGHESSVDYEVNDAELLRVENTDTNSIYRTLVF